MNRQMKAFAQPRWAIDVPQVVPSKPQPTIKKKEKKHVKPPEKPEKIELMLRDPAKRKHVGPCCKTFDGTICGTKKWFDGGGSDDGKGGKVYECMGCRKLLERPPFDGVTGDDIALENAVLDALAHGMAQQ
tara:strand:- start:325 stop:717 length:393 start_codon:yes stop_codon:yes gene_type:complete